MIKEILLSELGVGVISSTISALVAWFLARRKYNAEVSTTEIQNLKESLNFYKDVLDENQKLLKKYMDKVDESLVEIHNLRKAVSDLLATSCVDTICKKRKLVDNEAARKFLNVD